MVVQERYTTDSHQLSDNASPLDDVCDSEACTSMNIEEADTFDEPLPSALFDEFVLNPPKKTQRSTVAIRSRTTKRKRVVDSSTEESIEQYLESGGCASES